jgi:hypothetical protein
MQSLQQTAASSGDQPAGAEEALSDGTQIVTLWTSLYYPSAITAPEGVSVDSAGNVYGAVVPARMVQKHVRK